MVTITLGRLSYSKTRFIYIILRIVNIHTSYLVGELSKMMMHGQGLRDP